VGGNSAPREQGVWQGMNGQPANTDSSSVDARLGRVLDEVCARRARGEVIADAEVLAQYPELAEELGPQLAVLGELRARNPADEWVARGLFTRTSAGGLSGRLDSYEVERVIGRGGMGVVLKAREDRLRRPVALKVLRAELAEDAPALARFEREARTAASLQHPNIVSVYGLGADRGLRFIAMEYVDGPSLAEVLRGSGAAPLTAPQVRHLFRQLLEALGAAHASGLVHRDVKPSNLLLQGQREQGIEGSSDQGTERQQAGIEVTESAARGSNATPGGSDGGLPTLKLADFGLARLQSAGTRVTMTHAVLGTPEYMSPEQARGEPSLDQRADLYSAGVVLYEMLAGRTPFHTDSPTATIHRILHEEPAHPRRFAPDADPVLASLALRLLAKAPGDRLGTAEAAIRVLEEDRPTTLVHRRRRRGWQIVRAAAGALLVVALVGAGVLLARAPWLAGGVSALAARHIVGVQVDEADARLIRASWTDTATPTVFAKVGVPVSKDAVVVIPEIGADGPRVFAGLDRQLDGANLLAFDEQARECWRVELADGRSWPDCSTPGEWVTTCLLAGRVQPHADEVLVAIAHDQFLYPCRVSIVEPATGKVGATFWHMGHLSRAKLVPDLLGPPEARRAGLVVWGLNNKLDGFRTRQPGDDLHRTKFDYVAVVMILDPLHLDGLGPPRVDRGQVDLPPAQPVFYGFLDLPASPNPADMHDGVARDQTVTPLEQYASISEVSVTRQTSGQPPAFVLYIVRPDTGEHMPAVWRGLLRLTAELEVAGFEPSAPEVGPTRTDEYWRARWHVIVRNGEYVSD